MLMQACPAMRLAYRSVALIDARQEFGLGNRSAGNLAGNIGWHCAVPLPK
jgi:hypothetical protein